jgi:hypothetical protein
MKMLKATATLVLAGGLAVFGTRAAATAAPTQDDAVAKKTLTVTIIGSTSPARNTNCQYTASVSGGTPPYSYSWIGVGLIDGWDAQTATYNWSTIGNKALRVDVQDALSDTGYADLGVTVLSTGSC